MGKSLVGIIAVVFLGALAGCGTVAEKRAVVEPPARDVPRVSIEQRMLKRAEKAFRDGNLTKPAHENAYDLFHSVLMVNPKSQQARSGIQAILIRYAELIRSAIKADQYSKSERLLSQVEQYFPANDLLMELRKRSKQQRKAYLARQKKVPDAQPENLTVSEFVLPGYALSRRTPELSGYIGSGCSVKGV